PRTRRGAPWGNENLRGRVGGPRRQGAQQSYRPGQYEFRAPARSVSVARRPGDSGSASSRAGARLRGGRRTGERLLDDARLLCLVGDEVPLGRRGALGASDVAHLVLAGELAQVRLYEAPGAHVLRLLLDPDDLLPAGVERERLLELLGRERVEPLHA